MTFRMIPNKFVINYFGIFVVAFDVPANGLFFCTYEFLQNEFKKNTKQGNINLMGTLLAGGLSGMSYWMVGMPADVLKSRLQSAPEGTYKHGLRSVFQELLAKDGVLGLYTGAASVLLRAFPANAACFFGIELTNKILEYFFPDL